MFGFLAKILIVVVLVVGALGYFGFKVGSLSLKTLPKDLTQLDLKSVLGDTAWINFKSQIAGISGQQWKDNISGSLDSLVTHASKNSPVVLGVKVTNESVGVVTDALMGLPSDKLEQIRNALCATPSAR